MSLIARSILVAVWILVVGIPAVCFEVEERRGGARVRQLLLRRDTLVESVRRKQVQYNRILSPDLLQRSLPPAFDGRHDGKEVLTEDGFYVTDIEY